MTESATARTSGLRRLIEAAGEIVAEQGWRDASVVEIGQRAGLSRGAVNYHFGSKDELLQRLVTDLFEWWEARPALDDSLGMAALLDDYTAAVLGEPQRARLLAMLFYESLGPSPAITERARDGQRALVGSVERQLVRLQRLGEVREPLDCRGAATYVVGAIAGLALEPEPERDQAIPEFRATVLALVAA